MWCFILLRKKRVQIHVKTEYFLFKMAMIQIQSQKHVFEIASVSYITKYLVTNHVNMQTFFLQEKRHHFGDQRCVLRHTIIDQWDFNCHV